MSKSGILKNCLKGTSSCFQQKCSLSTTAIKSGKRINVSKPIVDMDGDEMTRIIWQNIKEKVKKKLFFQFLTDLLFFNNLFQSSSSPM